VIKHGRAPFLECSTRGDSRFSAFCAIVNGRSIESTYQSSKVFADGTTGLHWRKAKGQYPVNADYCHRLYSWLWRVYIHENPELVAVLKASSGLSDQFGEPGHACQATDLWTIRNWHISQDNLTLWGFT
jgi:hypothetical protein